MSDANQTSKEFINKERREILHQIDTWLEIPMIGLGLVWTVLLIIEFVWGLNSFLNGVIDSPLSIVLFGWMSKSRSITYSARLLF